MTVLAIACAIATPAAAAPTLASRVRVHEARALQRPARLLRVACTGRTCIVRTCYRRGFEVNGRWLPARMRELVTVTPAGRYRYGTMTFDAGRC